MNEKKNVPLLEVRGVSKRFGGTQALLDVSFDLLPGEVHALMGENGAGKSTLMKILSGTLSKNRGEILVNGIPVEVQSPSEAREHGIAIIHQELSNVPDMTVAENLALGQLPSHRGGVLDRKTMNQNAKEKLEAVGLDINPRQNMRELTIGMQQLVEIARAVSEDAKILILDEPTSALSRTESERLFEIIEQMRRGGVGLIYISHRMEEVWTLSDRVTVFRDGRLIGTQETGQIVPDDVVRMMVGRPLTDLYKHALRVPGKPILETRGLEGSGVGPVDFIVHSGEVVCLTGLVGAGRTELARLIVGADKPAAGRVAVAGREFVPKSPGGSIQMGVGMLPEDRKGQALFMQQSVLENTGVSSLKDFSKCGVLRRRAMKGEVKAHAEKMNLKASSLNAGIASLSGGNQQKVVFARWLMNDADVLIMDEPTRGVDIGAKREIYELIDEMVAKGKGILMISSELPEALGVSDRLLVMRGGQVVANLDASTATEEQVMAYATGTKSETKGDSL